MTWAELIREYYKKCMETDCVIMLDIQHEFGADYIYITARKGKKRTREIIGYVGLGPGGIDGRMKSYDVYKDPDDYINVQIESMVNRLLEDSK